ncbi:response regulator [Flexithrix dorotheae]|uniref:response regulator n=1 Tax=Flexithrix dorotheae TaxID=70993 RepID=UPI00036FA82A|nr:response regulator [Flexithrix dorotheae]
MQKLPKKQLLIVDDNRIDNLIISKFVEKITDEINIQFEFNGASAITYLKNSLHLPPLIFLDLHMPLVNGFDFLDKFEKEFSEKLPHTKVIVISSSINPADKAKALSFRSVESFISKPVDKKIVSRLLNMIEVN